MGEQMGENINIQGYLENVNAPWGQLFYLLVWHNIECEGKRILDFGSGFGITADHFARNNEVTAIEPNEDMLNYRICTNKYNQIVGGIEQLYSLPNQSYDMILCHNVLEYLDNRAELLSQFKRLLKPDGILSIVKHNKAGKIMQKAVFDYKIDEAMDLINDDKAKSANFGTINLYSNEDLIKYSFGAFRIVKVYGVRMFFALQSNEFKMEPDWIFKMYKLEAAAEEIPEFRDIAFFHHIILKHS